MKQAIEKLEKLIEFGGIKKDIALLIISGIALVSVFSNCYRCLSMRRGWQSSSEMFPLYWKQLSGL